jgi:hypothetical protein
LNGAAAGRSNFVRDTSGIMGGAGTIDVVHLYD